MIDREVLKRAANEGRKPDEAVRRNLGAGGSGVPVVGPLLAALERGKVGLPQPTFVESRRRGRTPAQTVLAFLVVTWGGMSGIASQRTHLA